MKNLLFTLSFIEIFYSQGNAQLEVKGAVKMKYFIEAGFQTKLSNTGQIFVVGEFERKLTNKLSWRGSATFLYKI